MINERMTECQNEKMREFICRKAKLRKYSIIHTLMNSLICYLQFLFHSLEGYLCLGIRRGKFKGTFEIFLRASKVANQLFS